MDKLSEYKDQWGYYRLERKPPWDGKSLTSNRRDPSIVLELDGQASLPDMIRLFDAFLRACGFPMQGRVVDVVQENADA